MTPNTAFIAGTEIENFMLELGDLEAEGWELRGHLHDEHVEVAFYEATKVSEVEGLISGTLVKKKA